MPVQYVKLNRKSGGETRFKTYADDVPIRRARGERVANPHEIRQRDTALRSKRERLRGCNGGSKKECGEEPVNRQRNLREHTSPRSEEHTSELQSLRQLVCRPL